MKKVHRFIGVIGIEGEIARIQDPDIARQASSVLKLKPGEIITLCDGQGQAWTGPIQGFSKTEIEIEIQETFSGGDGYVRDLSLYIAMLKNDHFDIAIQKAVECGVQRIFPVISRRTIKTQLKPERTQKIIREAAEQSGRMVLPGLGETLSFSQAVDQWKKSGTPGLFFDTESRHPLQPPSGNVCAYFIGPEGGWDEEEIERAKQAGLQGVHLGPMVLRAETAVTVATYVLSHTP